MIDFSGNRVREAYHRIQHAIVQTPLESVSDLLPGNPVRLLFKMENLQHTGSFKLRGATNKILSLTPEEAARGVIAASNGNHGLAVAAAARRLNIPVEVYVSPHVSPTKARRIEEYGAVIRRAGTNPLEAELAARAAATQQGKVFISPYNDPEVMAGQGTIAVELEKQQPGIDAIFIAVGGGGLIGGIGLYAKRADSKWPTASRGLRQLANSLKQNQNQEQNQRQDQEQNQKPDSWPMPEIVGCWPENSRVLYESMKAGKIIDFPEQPTLSESTAGGLEPDSVTLPVCKQVIDRSVLVTEDEIAAAIKRIRDAKGWIIEGAAGVAVAAFLKEAEHYRGKTVVVVICGGNVVGK